MAGPDRFPFQLEGAEFLSARPRALLGDEQGLGKSAQAIDAATHIGAERVLVLSKAVAKINWSREFAKWSDIERPVCIPRPGEKIPKSGPSLTVINYDIVHRPEILGRLVRRQWDVLIADEIQMLKAGIESRRGQAVLHPELGLHTTAEFFWGLSGTPAPNHAGDLFAWLKANHPELIADTPTYEDFLARYTYFQETPYGIRVLGNRDAEGLRALLKPVMLRRRRKKVLPQLPKLTVDTITVEGKEIPGLRALEAHPDIDFVRDLIDGLAPEENPEAFLRISDVDMTTLRRFTGLAKVEAAAELIAEELDNGVDKIVVMCWHRDVIDTLVRLLKKYGARAIHGGTSSADKQTAIDLFQESTKCRVIVGQIQSAGTSITLTAAARMIFVEASWVPGDNEQAVLRIMRIGQQRGCRASFLCLDGSLDEVVMRVYARKVEMLDEFLD